MKFDVICLEDAALKALVDKVVAYIKAEHGIKEDKWLTPEETMAKLNITSSTTLQKYRNEGKFKVSEITPRHFMYDRDSINEYLEEKSRDKF